MEDCFLLKNDTVIPKQGWDFVIEDPMLPVYPGGEARMIKDLQDNLIYPELEKSKGVQGIVMVQFYVEKDGSINEVKVIRGIKDGENLDKEAVKAVKKLKNFIPTKNHKGESMRTALTLPVRFRLPQETDINPKK